jgi:hypothetical protein
MGNMSGKGEEAEGILSQVIARMGIGPPAASTANVSVKAVATSSLEVIPIPQALK